jgi:hypothetical protein
MDEKQKETFIKERKEYLAPVFEEMTDKEMKEFFRKEWRE